MKIDLSFSKSSKTACDLAVFVCSDKSEYPESIELVGDMSLVNKAASVSNFEGSMGDTFAFVAPDGSPFDKVLVCGANETDCEGPNSWLKLGGRICAKLGSAKKISIYTQVSANPSDAKNIADMAMGLMLRAYSFDQYKTQTPSDKKPSVCKVKIVDGNHASIKKSFALNDAVVEGVTLARNMVNEPANILGPEEFAQKAKDLEEFGISTQILNEKQMAKLGMDALLGVALGSERPARLAIMHWNGGKKAEAPLAFIGKGVVFDTGGISIKPSGGMEDMKGDMGGAAAVIGLMKTLAMRKAKTNVVGILGLVENMPDGKAQRPGDIVTSMSGQTIEIINTDAEGRLVLCDALWYCKEHIKPKFMINLATLTGAVLVALGNHHAGLFSTDDELAGQLSDAGCATGEKVWRLPLAKEYDKMIDSKFADMKNTGGRFAGSITAAQFLRRFVGDVPWAHIDVAGTAMGSPKSDINTSWGSGYGVRLLNELVAEFYEK